MNYADKCRKEAVWDAMDDSCGSEPLYGDYENFYEDDYTRMYDEAKDKWGEMTKAGLRACLVQSIAYKRSGGEDCPLKIVQVSVFSLKFQN